jgi:hypothetical protein
MFKILETASSPRPLPKPVALVLNYAALDFNFTSWMAPGHLKVLRSQVSQGHIPGIEEMKDHFSGSSPLDVAGSTDRGQKSWTGESAKGWTEGMGRLPSRPASPVRKKTTPLGSPTIGRRVKLWEEPELMNDIKPQAPTRKTIGTRLTMASRTGFFQDRIISPSMVRMMSGKLGLGTDVSHRCARWPFYISALRMCAIGSCMSYGRLKLISLFRIQTSRLITAFRHC